MPQHTYPLSASNFFAEIPHSILMDIQKVTSFLKKEYGAKCYIVGGAVRDHLLGLSGTDFDIECFGISPDDFEKAMGTLGAEGVGKSFFVYKYRQLDIALPRLEKKVGRGHRGFEVSLATEEREASRRRDFTVNALMYDPEREELLDFWGGVEDLHRKLLRVVDRNSFTEDSLRLLRAMQFAARFGFRIEEESCRVCRGISLDDLPKERIFTEFEKMFRGIYPHYGLYYLFALGIARQLFSADIDRQRFIKWGKVLARYRDAFLEPLLPYYFLYISAPLLGNDITKILDRIGAPGVYYKKIAEVPPIPGKIECAFVADAARREGINSFVGNYHPRVRALADKLGIWSQPFVSDVAPALLMAEGFREKALGDELERRRRERIGKLDEDCTES